MYKLLPLAFALISLSGFSLGCNPERGIKLTNYGFPDASGTPAYKCRGGQVVPTQAGDKTELGDGSFGNPYAAAAAGNSIFKKCDLIYVPILKKYFRIQDDCSGCGNVYFVLNLLFSLAKPIPRVVAKQVDLYLIQSNKRIGQLGCEQKFGTLASPGHVLHEVVHNPGPGFATDTRPFFVDGKCFNKPSDGRVFPARDGRVKCGRNGKEEITTEDVDEGADAVDNSGSTNDDNPSARHKGQKPPTKRMAQDFSA